MCRSQDAVDCEKKEVEEEESYLYTWTLEGKCYEEGAMTAQNPSHAFLILENKDWASSKLFQVPHLFSLGMEEAAMGQYPATQIDVLNAAPSDTNVI